MRLIVFGSTGGTGLQLIKQALNKGYEVTAFTRNADKIKQSHKGLRILTGDVLDSKAVNSAVQGHDAVLCSLGMKNVMDKSMLRARGTKNIIHAMDAAGIKRLVCQSALGTGDSDKALPFIYRYFLVPVVMRSLYKDHNLQESHLKESSIDWTIVRPAILTDGAQTGIYQHGFSAENRTVKVKISRADVADFMLKQVTDNHYLYKTPSLSY